MKTRHGIFAFAATLLCAPLIGLIGYLLGTTLSGPETIAFGEPGPTAASASASGAAPGAPSGGLRQPASAAPVSEYDTILERNHLKPRELILRAAFPRTRTGEALTRISALLPFGPASATPEGRLVEEQLTLLRRQPDEALRDLREGFRKLDDNYAEERQFLIQFASRLDANPGDKMEFLVEELQRTSPAAAAGGAAKPNQASFNGVIALGAIIEIAKDPQTVEPLLREGLRVRQGSRDAQLLLLSKFESAFSGRSDAIKKEFGL